MVTERQQRGAQAEQLAERFLVSQGLVVLARNYRVKIGEIDLVCRERETVVFVEVRKRSEGALGGRFGGAAASITRAKQTRLVRAAQTFLMQFGDRPPAARFDAILVGSPTEIEWLKNIIQA
jgi:putative endonuclease